MVFQFFSFWYHYFIGGKGFEKFSQLCIFIIPFFSEWYLVMIMCFLCREMKAELHRFVFVKTNASNLIKKNKRSQNTGTLVTWCRAWDILVRKFCQRSLRFLGLFSEFRDFFSDFSDYFSGFEDLFRDSSTIIYLLILNNYIMKISIDSQNDFTNKHFQFDKYFEIG